MSNYSSKSETFCKAWPCLFWPQAQTSPMLVTAKLWNQPDKVAVQGYAVSGVPPLAGLHHC